MCLDLILKVVLLLHWINKLITVIFEIKNILSLKHVLFLVTLCIYIFAMFLYIFIEWSLHWCIGYRRGEKWQKNRYFLFSNVYKRWNLVLGYTKYEKLKPKFKNSRKIIPWNLCLYKIEISSSKVDIESHDNSSICNVCNLLSGPAHGLQGPLAPWPTIGIC